MPMSFMYFSGIIDVAGMKPQSNEDEEKIVDITKKSTAEN